MDFDDIRPYTDSELPAVLNRIIANKWVLDGVRKAYFPKAHESLHRILEKFIHLFLKLKTKGIKTTDQFRYKVSLKIIVKNLIKDTTAGITFNGLENLDTSKSYIFISNHRDIVLDPALMINVLYGYGFNFPQIAFGNNLMINEIVTDIIRANNGIIVKRNLPVREQIKESHKLSCYITGILEKGNSLWIAQREGRAKDGRDETNPAVLKMMYLCKRKEMTFSEFVRNYRVVPVSISYEYDPLDTAKGWSIYRKERHGFHTKGKYEDLLHIARGLKGYKGRVHLSFSEPLSGEYKNAAEAAVSLDHKIHTSYKLWKTNYIAYDLLFDNHKYSDKYSAEENEEFLKRFRKLSEGLRKIVLKAYANPVISFEKYNQTG